ncbi:MAG: repeat containing protein [Nevskia sp.]|nr:repeat containing protein [Nevskia sp.]
MAEPYGRAVDASGNLWVANFGGASVTEFIGLAAPVVTPKIGLPRRP